MPTTTFRGLPVAFREAGVGTDGVPALLAHCSLAHGGLWKPIIAALSETRRVRAPDMPAHGGTAPPPEGESLQLFAAAMCTSLIEEMGRPAHLVGLSLGGAVLGRVALARPDLVASLTLIEPVYFHLLRDHGHDAEADEDSEVMARIESCAEAGDMIGAVKAFVSVWGAPGGFESLGPKGQAHAARCLTHLRRDFAMVNGHPPGQIELADLARLEPPVMLMSGERTPPAATAILDVIASALPGARRRVIAGAGHLSPVTHWQAVLAEIEAFFALAEAPVRAA